MIILQNSLSSLVDAVFTVGNTPRDNIPLGFVV